MTVAAPGLTKSAPSKLDSERCLQRGAPHSYREWGDQSTWKLVGISLPHGRKGWA